MAGSRKGIPNKSHAAVKDIIDTIGRAWAKKKGYKNSGVEVAIERLMDLADGVQLAEIKDGKSITYIKEPDAIAIKTLLEFRFGKPSQAVELSGKDGQALATTLVVPAFGGTLTVEPRNGNGKRNGNH